MFGGNVNVYGNGVNISMNNNCWVEDKRCASFIHTFFRCERKCRCCEHCDGRICDCCDVLGALEQGENDRKCRVKVVMRFLVIRGLRLRDKWSVVSTLYSLT